MRKIWQHEKLLRHWRKHFQKQGFNVTEEMVEKLRSKLRDGTLLHSELKLELSALRKPNQ